MPGDQFQLHLSAEIIAFPAYRRLKEARDVAEAFISEPDKSRNQYWQKVARKHVADLQRVGLSKADAELSLDSFRQAVQREIDLIMLQEMQKQR